MDSARNARSAHRPVDTTFRHSHGVPLIALALAISPLAAQSGWSVPVPETALNSTAADSGPHLSLDGLQLHFASFRSGNWEIYSSTRAAVGQPWGAPVLESALNDAAGTDDQPFLAPGGLEILFASTRAGGAGGFDILRATRAAPGQPWNTPVFVPELSSTGSESSPSMTLDELEVWFLSTSFGAPFAPQNAIFHATRTVPSGPFNPPTLVAELANANSHRDAEISLDGLSIAYTEFVGTRLRVLVAERTNRSAPFGPPVAIAEFDTVGTATGVFSFTRSVLGNEAFLAAGFAAAAGGQEILSTRFDGLTHFGVAGGSSTMTLAWRDSLNPGQAYLIGAALGNTGFPLGTRLVPLDPDFLLAGTLGNDVPGFTTGWAGVLDPTGEAFGSLTNPVAAFAGLTIHVGALTLDRAAPFGVATIGNSFRAELQ